MNREALDKLAEVSSAFYFDALERYPCLLLDASQEPDGEALVVWRVLMVLDELNLAVVDAQRFDERDRPADNPIQEELPF